MLVLARVPVRLCNAHHCARHRARVDVYHTVVTTFPPLKRWELSGRHDIDRTTLHSSRTPSCPEQQPKREAKKHLLLHPAWLTTARPKYAHPFVQAAC